MCGMVLWPLMHGVSIDTSVLEEFSAVYEGYCAANQAYLNAVKTVR